VLLGLAPPICRGHATLATLSVPDVNSATCAAASTQDFQTLSRSSECAPSCPVTVLRKLEAVRCHCRRPRSGQCCRLAFSVVTRRFVQSLFRPGHRTRRALARGRSVGRRIFWRWLSSGDYVVHAASTIACCTRTDAARAARCPAAAYRLDQHPQALKGGLSAKQLVLPISARHRLCSTATIPHVPFL
jgi:hypothetical protein